MKISCISDIHGQLPEIEETDLLLISGDICPTRDHSVLFQSLWLNTNFKEWLDKVPAKQVIGVAGNHDFVFQQAPYMVSQDLRWTYLECSSTEYGGLKIYGSPWQNWFYDWAFNAPRTDGEEFLTNIYDEIPTDTDIIVTHGPPWGGHPERAHKADLTRPYKGTPAQYVGSHALLDRMTKVHPRLTVTGHIHGGRGVYEVELSEDPSNPDKGCWPSFICNASLLNEQYIMVHDPVVFEWDEQKQNLSYTQP